MFSVAARDISAGEELHDCYGLPWYSVARATRQDITSRFYKFQCACAACAEDWCTSDMLGATTLRDLRRVVCAQCGAAVERGAGRRADVISII